MIRFKQLLKETFNFGNNDLTGIKVATNNGVIDDGNSGAAKTVDFSTGRIHAVTMTDNCTFTFTAPPGPCTILLRLVQDGTGSRTATWPGAVRWAGGAAPTLSTAASSIDWISFIYDGTNYDGSFGLDFS